MIVILARETPYVAGEHIPLRPTGIEPVDIGMALEILAISTFFGLMAFKPQPL
jgi:hypothetical protein